MSKTVTSVSPGDSGRPDARIRSILTGSAGNLVEWFDFYTYAFTALYFSSSFFPKADPLAQLMSTSGIYAVGFLVRPLGGWFFGRYADRHGRQGAVVISLLMMGLGSLFIAALPTYAKVGAIAPLLLLLGRMAQGFATGGQYGTIAAYLSEVAGKKRRGFFASFHFVSLIGGQILATLTIMALHAALGEEAMKAYGWRVAFALGGVGALGILAFRKSLHETVDGKDAKPNAGTMSEVGKHMRAFFTVIGLTAGGAVSFYTFTTLMQKYLTLQGHALTLTKPQATGLMTGVLVLFMLAQPMMGALSDKIGRRRNLIIFGVLSTLFTQPILAGLASASSMSTMFLLVLAGLLINSFFTSVSALFKAELFPVHIRALGVGLSYGIANALFGGTAESVALAFKSVGREHYFYWYVTALCAVSLLTALVMPDTRKNNPLDEIEI